MREILQLTALCPTGAVSRSIDVPLLAAMPITANGVYSRATGPPGPANTFTNGQSHLVTPVAGLASAFQEGRGYGISTPTSPSGRPHESS